MPNKLNSLRTENPLIIMGVDPGYGRLGVAIIKKEAKQKKPLFFLIV